MALMEYWDPVQKKNVTVSPDSPMPTAAAAPAPGSITTDQLADEAVTTSNIADGAVTDDKLASAKVPMPEALTSKVVLGTTLETSEFGLVGYSQSPMGDRLVMYKFLGQVATAAPQDDEDATPKIYVDEALGAKIDKTALDSVVPIGDTANATAAQVAEALNALIAALKA